MVFQTSLLPVAIGIPFGLLFGVGIYTFGYARGASYLTDDPTACANCHVMREQFDGWLKSSHRSAAVCNDCHTPPGLVAKYFTKALNGVNHSLAFTSGHFPDDILITARNHRVTEQACLKCHEEVTEAIRGGRHRSETFHCTGCHRNVGHGH